MEFLRFSVEEAAKKLKYHVKHVRHMVREGSLEDRKIGQTWLVKSEALGS